MGVEGAAEDEAAEELEVVVLLDDEELVEELKKDWLSRTACQDVKSLGCSPL